MVVEIFFELGTWGKNETMQHSRVMIERSRATVLGDSVQSMTLTVIDWRSSLQIGVCAEPTIRIK